MDPNRVIIFDTTLRDGEQSPGCSMNLAEKLEIARLLRDLGVDVIEAGFPIASNGDFEAVQAIAREIEGPRICGLARCNKTDIDRAAEAVKPSARPRIHVFLATSSIHREFKLKMSREEIVARAVEGVKRARDHVDDVEFSPEDAARTELDFLAEVVERAIEAGASTLNIPDTVGYSVPQHYAAIIRHLKSTVRGVENVVLSVHCHNDLGLAVANSLAALGEGARQVECTINGIGERAGNTSLEEIVMALRTRHDAYGLQTGIDTRLLFPISRRLSQITGMHVQRNKAIVGRNAFAHEAGIHQDGMLKERSTYEIMKPEDVGIRQTELVLGKHSGRHALRQKFTELGYDLNEQELNSAFDKFKQLADQNKEVYDSDLDSLAAAELKTSVKKPWTLHAFTCHTGTGTLPCASVVLWKSDGTIQRDAAVGDGPVDAVFNAIRRMTGVDVHLVDFRVRAVSIGSDAKGEASIEVEIDGQRYASRFVSTDILEAGAYAYLETINRSLSRARSSRAKQPAVDATN